MKIKYKQDIAYGLFTVVAALIILLIFVFFFLKEDSFSSNLPVKIYYVDNISEAHQQVIDKFNKENINRIEVVPVNLPFSKFTTNERKEILTRALRSGGERADVFAVDLIWIQRFAKWAYPLGVYSNQALMDNLDSRALESCFSDGQLVAFPLYLDVGLLYYRKDIIRALPNGAEIENKIKNSISWNEFIGLRKYFDLEKQDFFLFAGDKFEGMVCSFHETLSREISNKIFSEEKINLNIPEARYGLQLMVDLIYKYKMTPEIITGFDEYKAYIYALRNNAVFLRGWPGFHKHYRNILEDSTRLNNFAIAPLPHITGNTSSAVFGGWNLMVSKYSEHKKEAVEFIKFTLRCDVQKLMYEAGGYIPICKEVYQDTTYMERFPDLNFYKQIFKWGKHRPYRVDYTKMSDIMSYYLNKALKKQLTVEEALKLASDKINSEKAFIK